MTQPAAPVLELRGLRVAARGGEIVRGVDLTVGAGEIVGVMGESGCGKTTLGLAIAGLLDRDRWVAGGEILFHGEAIACADHPHPRALLGERISFVPQHPFTSFDPLRRVGPQVARPLRLHRGMGKIEAEERVVELLARLGVPAPGDAARRFPHQLSGGMLQRAAIATALSCAPDLVVADEPTTALDAIVRGQVLEAFVSLARELRSAIVLVTHDLDSLRRVASSVAAMYAGRIVEIGDTASLLGFPQHPYPSALLASSVTVSTPRGRLPSIEGQPPTLPGDLEPCAFAPRCPHADARCHSEEPLLAGSGGRLVACHHPLAGAVAR